MWAVSDPISQAQAEETLRRSIPDFDLHRAASQIELLSGTEWYLDGQNFDVQRITGGWNEKLKAALAPGPWRHESEQECVLDGNEALEGVLRLRARTRSISRRAEHDRALHLFRYMPPGPSICSMWRVHINAPS